MEFAMRAMKARNIKALELKAGSALAAPQLDSLIAELNVADEVFDDALESLIGCVDAAGCDLVIADPSTWRKPMNSKRACSFGDQFRADVNAILVMDRDEESRFAKRMQFARRRLRITGERDGVSMEEQDRLLLRTEAPSKRIERRAQELQALRTELVERNLYLVLINVERYARRGGSREDLIQEACISMFRAVDRFDWKRGLLFRTYAVHWLNQAFRNYLYNQSQTVRVPIYLQKALKHVRQAGIRLGKENATPEELAEETDLTPALIQSAYAAARRSYSIDTAGQGEGSARLVDSLVDESAEWGYSTRLEEVSLRAGLAHSLAKLPERDRRVIEMRYGIGAERESTLAEVAKLYGISLERVRQIQARALRNMASARLRREMEPFLN